MSSAKGYIRIVVQSMCEDGNWLSQVSSIAFFGSDSGCKGYHLEKGAANGSRDGGEDLLGPRVACG